MSSMFTRFALIASLASAVPALAQATPAPLNAGCPPAPIGDTDVPNFAAVLARHEPAIIVAIGSSSTRSWLASDPAHSYPAILQQELERRLPHAHIAVLNRGINGQDVAEELARLDADVLAVRPTLVIWQVGANGALVSTDPVAFRKLVTAGVARLHASGADVILMDNQRAPRLLAAPDNPAIDTALSDVARDTEAELFSRSALMDAWAAEGYPNRLFISSDNLHHNDLGYRCIAEALAADIVAGLGPREPGGNGPGSDSGRISKAPEPAPGSGAANQPPRQLPLAARAAAGLPQD